MADNTLIGVAAVVVIALIAAFFFAFTGTAPAEDLSNDNKVGFAGFTGNQPAQETCEPKRYCDGTKLVIIREDCSFAESYCQRGCSNDQGVCI